MVVGWSPATDKHDAVVVLVVLAYSSSFHPPSIVPNTSPSEARFQRAAFKHCTAQCSRACLVSAGSGNGRLRLCPTGLIHPRGWLAQPRTED